MAEKIFKCLRRGFGKSALKRALSCAAKGSVNLKNVSRENFVNSYPELWKYS